VTWNVTSRNHSGFDPNEFRTTGFTDISYNSQNSQRFRPGWKPPSIEGWQFLGTYQNLSTPLEQMLWIKHSPNQVSKLQSSGDMGEISTEKETGTQFIASVFYLNASIPKSEPDLVPYNSTLWFNGTKIGLEAPFLQFKTWCVILTQFGLGISSNSLNRNN